MKNKCYLFFLFVNSLSIQFFLSESSMAQWQSCGGPGGCSMHLLASDSVTVFASTYVTYPPAFATGSLYASNDSGVTWSAPPLNGYSGIFGISAMTVNNNKLYLDIPESFTTSTLYISTDQGNNLTSMNNGYTLPLVNCIEVSGPNIYLGTATGVEVSTNSGVIWTLQNSGFSDPIVKDIVVSGTTVLAATTDGVYSSVNNGANWSLTSLHHDINSLTTNGSDVYASGDGVFVSSNSGASWTTVNSGLPGNFLGSDIMIVNGKAFTCSSFYGVYVSSLPIVNWALCTTGLTNIYVHHLTSIGTDIFCSNYTGVSKSVSNGAYWTSPNLGYHTLSINCMAVDSPTVYAGTGYSGIFRSDDFATTWLPVDSNIPQNCVVKALAAQSNRVIASIVHNSGSNDNSIYCSMNGGISWTEVFSPIANMTINALAINGNTFFAGTSDSGIYVSYNLGGNWARMNYGLPGSNVTAFTLCDSVIYTIVSGAGVFRSFDEGVTWNIFNMGLASLNCAQLTATRTDVYVTEGGKIYKSNNSLNNWTYLYGPINNNSSADCYIYWIGAQNNTVFAAPWYYGGYGYPRFTVHSLDGGITWAVDTFISVPETTTCILVDGSYAFMGSGDASVWCFNTLATGIPNLQANASVTVFPNPSSGVFNLEWDKNKNGDLIIRNMIGQRVFDQKIIANSRISFDLDGLSKGIYVYTIITDERNFAGKLMLK